MGALLGSVESKIIAALVAVIVLLGVLGIFYYKYSENQIQTLTSNVAKLTEANQTDEATIAAQTKFAQDQSVQIVTLQKSMQESQSEYDSLVTQFQTQNITASAQSNAPALQNQLNAETASLLNNITALTVPAQSTGDKK